MDRESFVFYRSFYEALQNVPKKNRSEVYEAVFTYVFESQEPSVSGVTRALWELIKPQLDASQKRYENSMKGAEYGKKGAEYGKLGGRPRKEKTPLKGDIGKPPKREKDQNPLNVNVNENVNDNENVNVNVNASGSDGDTLTRPPTVKEVVQAAKELGYHMTEIEAQKFIDYNDALGWKLRPSYALQKWFENRSQMNRSPAGKFANFPQRHDAENYEMKMKIINGQIGGNL